MESLCLAIDIFYDFVNRYQLKTKTLEAFAGSLNSSLPDYCSLFYDIEKKFGSKGSFFMMDINNCKYDLILANPPFIAEVIHTMINKLLEYLDRCPNSTVFICIPDWRSNNEYKKDKEFQINLGLKEKKRYDVPYQGYSKLQNSKYYKYVIAVQNLSYYNFFADTRRNINVPTLILVLSNNKDNGVIEKFKKYVIQNA